MQHQNLQTNCNHDYEFKISKFKDMKWINFYRCRKCGGILKVYNSNLRHDQSVR